MSTSWQYHQSSNQWTYKSAGADYSVECAPDGWIDIDTHRPDYGIPVMAVGQLVFASTAAPMVRQIDVLREDARGSHWTTLRNVTHWHPLTPMPERYR